MDGKSGSSLKADRHGDDCLFWSFRGSRSRSQICRVLTALSSEGKTNSLRARRECTQKKSQCEKERSRRSASTRFDR